MLSDGSLQILLLVITVGVTMTLRWWWIWWLAIILSTVVLTPLLARQVCVAPLFCISHGTMVST